jgi:hypothetical protein
VQDLFTLVTAEVLLDHVLGDKGERSQRTRLGVELGRAADRVFGEFRLERAGQDHKERQLYRLTRPANSQPPQAEAEWSA